MTSENRYYSCGESTAENRYHYTQCGLDNIFLVSGYSCQEIDGTEYVSIKVVEGLWKAIGISIATEHSVISPQEIRFLRTHMELTQEELARKLGTEAQTLARWEKSQTKLQGPADLALRTLFLTSPVAQPEGCEIIRALYALIEKRERESCPDFSATKLIRTMNMDDDNWSTSTNDTQLSFAGI